MGDWFDKLLDVGLEAYKVSEGVSNQAAVTTTVQRQQQTGAEPADPRLYYTDYQAPPANPGQPAPAVSGGIGISANLLLFVGLGVAAFLILR